MFEKNKVKGYIKKGELLGFGYAKKTSEEAPFLLQIYLVLKRDGQDLEFEKYGNTSSYFDSGSRDFEIEKLEKKGYQSVDSWKEEDFKKSGLGTSFQKSKKN